jgi:para-aminobenzoate synthetase component 1
VTVEELFGVYPFRQVWQMISTISGRLDKKNDGLSTIKAAFPPGSMTGAPKIISMQLIEQYEQSRRGVYSGVLGYISPDGDFDFNVVIRSMFYNSENKYLSFQTGGAIVYDSDPEKEYEECLLKAKGMRLALNVEY